MENRAKKGNTYSIIEFANDVKAEFGQSQNKKPVTIYRRGGKKELCC
jgi:hypothetical protein